MNRSERFALDFGLTVHARTDDALYLQGPARAVVTATIATDDRLGHDHDHRQEAPHMADVTTLIDTYSDAWNERDPGRRRTLVEHL